jgi:hypothetical protein
MLELAVWMIAGISAGQTILILNRLRREAKLDLRV